jgi:toxin CcdB
MALYDLYGNPSASQPGQPAFFVVLQSDFVENLPTQLVAPLYASAKIGPMPTRVCPIVIVDGVSYVVVVSQMAGIPKSRAGALAGSIKEHRDELTAAIDFLLSGF